uniref:Uncharacterized protein AlNc14C4G569 n=1 Tax=Albugo laibachii Nc14 TaxID=890382 RepID=F0W0C6_9STRA|nr:hypothetical protein SELMODRAFT_438667 [Albugo laibachii Nc14]|eukprot:CCA14498.1 hypothetical protein SELMODRAFT_438667 [Albugo laibachii Nc14]
MSWVLEEICGAKGDANCEALEPFYALSFPNKHGSAVMKLLVRSFGTLVQQGYPHLKRIKKHTEKEQLIALLHPLRHDISSYEDDREQLTKQFQGEVHICDILSSPPKSKERWAIQTKQWPLIFHSSVSPESSRHEKITEEESFRAAGYIETVLNRPEERDSADCLHQFQCSHTCLVVDAILDKVVCLSSHAVRDEKYAFETTYHPIMIAIDHVALRDRACKHQSAGQCMERNHELENPPPLTSYLCTSYDVYLDVEPCVMCAMALIHSRVRRVFFHERNHSHGALGGSGIFLQSIKSLNHHYRVFHAVKSSDG